MLQCGVFSLEVLGTGSLGSTPSIIAASDNERLLFECGDGTQRLCTEYGARVSKISRIYLTTNNPQSNGGLGGFLLTRSDLPAGGKTTVIGPPGVGKIVRAYRHFYNRPNCLVSVFEIGCTEFPETTSDGICVKPVMLGGAKEPNSFHLEKRSKKTSPSEVGRGFEIFDSEVPSLNPGDLSFATCYILSLPERRGKFHPEKARKLGVKPGPDFGKLTRGEAITLSDGTRVTPEQCMDVSEPPPMAAIIRCPSLAHLVELDRAPEIVQLQKVHASQLMCVVHLVPDDVIRTPEYQEWAARFSIKTKHVAIGENISPTHSVFLASCKLQCRLSVLDPVAFPFREPVVSLETTAHGESCKDWTFADTKTRFILAPTRTRGLDISLVPKRIDVEEVRAAAKELLDVGHVGSDLRQQPIDVTTEAPEILFLGTGSAIPSKYRNVSALMIHSADERVGGIMVDCGEGSIAQLCRSLGSIQAARARIYRLAFVWVSHMHADHHLGLLTLLYERIRAGALPPLIVAGPSALNNFLSEYARAVGGDFGVLFMRSFTFLDCEAMLRHKQADFEPPALRQMKELAGLRAAVSVNVLHCYKAYGLVLESRAGWKFVYSGDTEFCGDLIAEGTGADVLVHEATFEDGKEDEAREKRHSTISQALRAAVSMQAKVVIFSHFSQRYPKNPPLPETLDASTIPVFAFDMMSFRNDRALQIANKTCEFDTLLAEGQKDDDEEESADGTV